jgi:thioesterase CepJ
VAGQSVVANGIRLSYDVSGEGQQVLLIAGTGMSGAVWEFLGASSLREAGYQVITFDNRGVGDSEGPPGPYLVGDMAADTVALVEHLGVADILVVGLSLGGCIAQQMAVMRPDLVRALVLWASAGRTPAFFRRLQAVEREIASVMPIPESLHLWEYLLISLPFTSLQNDDALVESLADVLAGGVEWSGDGRAGQFGADVEWDTADHSDLYPRIQCPCLVIAHEHDLIYPPPAGRAAARAMPAAAFLEIPGMAHGQATDAAPRVFAEVMEFFARTKNSSST